MFQHFIITEFNIKLESDFFATDKNKQPVLTREWLVNRFKLFETYYLPSLAQQTCKNFHCLIFFDIDTEKEFRDRLAELQKKYPFFSCFYVTGYSEVKNKIHDFVMSKYDGSAKFILTTHMDNDDALHKDAIAAIQQAFRPKHEYGINLCKGYRYFAAGKQSVLLKNSFINGPFCSLIEELKPNYRLRTMNSLSHHTFFDNYKVKQIRGGYYWLQSIHEANLINDLTGWPSLNKEVLKDFGLSTEGIELTLETFIKYALKFIKNPKNFVPFYLRYIIVRKILKKYSTAC